MLDSPRDAPLRFLVVEDNPRLARQLQAGLEEHQFQVDVTHSGRDGEQMAVANAYDGIILDLMLPDYDGFQLCRNLRRRDISTPILMLTVLSSTADKVAGLEAGADDYLTKPFELDELVARLKALLRRTQTIENPKLRYEDIEMDLVGHKVFRGPQPIPLTSKEFALLEYFMRNPNRVLTRSMIGERVWDMLFEEESNVIEVYVSRLRSKIDKGFDRKLIHTVIGTGYILSAEGPPA